MDGSSRAPYRCFIAGIPGLKNAQATEKVRVLGTVVSTAKIEKNENASTNPYHEQKDIGQYQEGECTVLVLDDGTGIVHCITPMAIIERVSVRVGQTFDCIGEVHRHSLENSPMQQQQQQQHQRQEQQKPILMIVDTLLEVRNQPDSERLRWLEICAERNPQNSHQIAWCGYPCPQASSDDILVLIESNQDEGVKISELAMVLDMEEPQVLALVEELQMQGQIYQNEKGCYVPL